MRHALSLLVLVSAQALADDTFSLSSGFDFSSGKYGGTTTTDILYIPVTAKYETDDLALKLTIPYIRMTSAGGVVHGMGRIGPTTQQKATTDAGQGDVTASATYTALDNDNLSIDLVGNVKLGTADAKKNLGTGKNDYSAEADFYNTIASTTLYLYAGHTVVGVPAGTQLHNINYGSLGASQKLNEQTTASLTLDVSQSASPLSAQQRELIFDVAEKFDHDLKVTASLLRGFSSGSPDWGFGLIAKGIF